MDTSDPAIEFAPDGTCNHCRGYDRKMEELRSGGRYTLAALERRVEAIKRAGRGRPYDCLIGLSGGIDSSYLAYVARRQFGLRPLAWHFDNGWDSELAVKNIENIVRKLEIDLVTYVVDWEEFRDLQLSFIKASVIDIELVTDHPLIALSYRIARKHGIRHALIGGNATTEWIMPTEWKWWKWDVRNIRAIQRQFGSLPIRSYPLFSMQRHFLHRFLRGVRHVNVLDCIPYNPLEARALLERELGYRYYGGKHRESTFTKFYQGYILPVKFGVDKRRAHLATLVCAGQMTRADALAELAKPVYGERELAEDRAYVCKKLGLEESAFEELMRRPVRSHRDYPTDEPFLALLRRLSRRVSPQLKERMS
jgi:N-acetyl sugar amidotransferase